MDTHVEARIQSRGMIAKLEMTSRTKSQTLTQQQQ